MTLLVINIQMTRNSVKVAIYSVSWNPTKGFSQSGIQLEVRNWHVSDVPILPTTVGYQG